jgi:ribosome-associated protein
MTGATDTAPIDDAIDPPDRPVAPSRSFHNLPPVPENEVAISAIRAQGAGGQNVNKVSSAIHLRFVIAASSLPAQIKQRLLALNDQRITKDGVVVIKSQVHRSQERNRADALQKLNELVASVALAPKARRPTRPTRSSQTKRLDRKNLRGQVKSMRGKIKD